MIQHLWKRWRSDRRWFWGGLGLASLGGAALIYSAWSGDLTSSDSLLGLSAQMFLRAGVVIGLLYLSLALLKRWQTGGARQRRLETLETLRLSPRQALHLIRLDGRTLLVGASDAQINLLTEVDSANDGLPGHKPFEDFLTQVTPSLKI
ncbi:MAG: flagellar biosynthetic protein FliO [Chloroflexota bacterium]